MLIAVVGGDIRPDKHIAIHHPAAGGIVHTRAEIRYVISLLIDDARMTIFFGHIIAKPAVFGINVSHAVVFPFPRVILITGDTAQTQPAGAHDFNRHVEVEEAGTGNVHLAQRPVCPWRTRLADQPIPVVHLATALRGRTPQAGVEPDFILHNERRRSAHHDHVLDIPIEFTDFVACPLHCSIDTLHGAAIEQANIPLHAE